MLLCYSIQRAKNKVVLVAAVSISPIEPGQPSHMGLLPGSADGNDNIVFNRGPDDDSRNHYEISISFRCDTTIYGAIDDPCE